MKFRIQYARRLMQRAIIEVDADTALQAAGIASGMVACQPEQLRWEEPVLEAHNFDGKIYALENIDVIGGGL